MEDDEAAEQGSPASVHQDPEEHPGSPSPGQPEVRIRSNKGVEGLQLFLFLFMAVFAIDSFYYIGLTVKGGPCEPEEAEAAFAH